MNTPGKLGRKPQIGMEIMQICFTKKHAREPDSPMAVASLYISGIIPQGSVFYRPVVPTKRLTISERLNHII